MFGFGKRKDAPGQTGKGRGTEPLVTAATEPVLPPPPPPPLAPPIASELAPPAPPVAAPDPAPPVAPPIAAAEPAPPVAAPDPAPPADPLSQADIRARTLLADSIARMELQLSQPETAAPPAVPAAAYPVPAAGNGAIEALAESVAKTASEVARALEQMSGMCAMLAERLDADREERRVLTEAIARLGVGANGAVTTDAPSSVLGGTVFAAPPVAPDDDVISIVDEPRAIQADPSPAVSMFAAPPIAREREAVFLSDDDSDVIEAPSTSFFASPPVARDDEISIVTEDEISIVEDDELVASAASEPVGAGMWCRDEDQWIGGVEIADFVSDNGTIRYWLRRTSDGRMLPRPFDATDLRFVRETTPAD
jgi:hypothetical protein